MLYQNISTTKNFLLFRNFEQKVDIYVIKLNYIYRIVLNKHFNKLETFKNNK